MFRSSYSYGAATALIHWGDHQNLWIAGFPVAQIIQAGHSCEMLPKASVSEDLQEDFSSPTPRRLAGIPYPAAAERLDQRDDGKKAILPHGQRGLLSASNWAWATTTAVKAMVPA